MFVPTLVIVTVAFTTIAPLWSVTWPRTCARYAPCAKRAAGTTSNPKTIVNQHSQDELRRKERIDPPGRETFILLRVKTITFVYAESQDKSQGKVQPGLRHWGHGLGTVIHWETARINDLGDNYGCSIDRVILHGHERLVCLVKRENRHPGA